MNTKTISLLDITNASDEGRIQGISMTREEGRDLIDLIMDNDEKEDFTDELSSAIDKAQAGCQDGRTRYIVLEIG